MQNNGKYRLKMNKQWFDDYFDVSFQYVFLRCLFALNCKHPFVLADTRLAICLYACFASNEFRWAIIYVFITIHLWSTLYQFSVWIFVNRSILLHVDFFFISAAIHAWPCVQCNLHGDKIKLNTISFIQFNSIGIIFLLRVFNCLFYYLMFAFRF